MSFSDQILGKGTGGEPPEYTRLVQQSMEELRLKTAAHDGTWHLSQADWTVDQDAGTILFTTRDGITATCMVQIIGTYDTEYGSWLWGWEHPSVATPLQEHAKQVRAYGVEHGIERLTTQELNCDESEAWEFAALACKLCGAQGAYRGPAGSVLVFMTFGKVMLKKTG